MITLYKTGEEFFCRHCEAHIFTFKHDLCAGDQFQSSVIDQSKGQAPWGTRTPLRCRQCSKEFGSYLLLKSCSPALKTNRIRLSPKEISFESPKISKQKKEFNFRAVHRK